jgi:hypothetical protein
MAKKLEKAIEGTKVTITEVTTNTALNFDFASLPADIQAKLGPFGLGHKLGDAAAGKEGQEAIDSINKVYNGLASGDWSVRAPAGEKVSVKSLLENLKDMDPAQAELMKGILAKMGLKVGG